MNIQVSNNLINQNHTTGVTGGSQVAPSDGNTSGSQGGNPLAGLSQGSSVTGMVMEARDGMVTIQLADATTVLASLKGGISLEAGSQVTFLINSNQNNQVVLSPLFTNLGASPNVENALRAAELPINSETAAMVTHMMEQGMSIDKDALHGMYRQIVDNPGIDSRAVVRLNQMNLAVNEMNASQLQAYDNLNHQLSGAVNEMIDGLTQTLSNITAGNEEGMLRFFDGLVELFGEKGTLLADNTTDGSVVLKNNGASLGMQGTEGAVNTAGNGQLLSILSGKELEGLTELLKQAGAGEETLAAISKGENSAKEALQLIGDTIQNQAATAKESATLLQGWESLLGGAQDKNAVWKELMTDPSLGKILKDVMQRNFLMEPKEVESKEAVEAFFKKLQGETAKLANMASNTLGKESIVAQSASRMNQNVDFLNQLNQTFTYVQIPLKMSGQNANGDLYVYTNKKNLAAKDGNVSAFLHLDMDYLGSVDVYVTMEKQKVSTNFKVADDSVLDLIEANIDMLNARLEKRGYQLRSTVEMQKEEVSVVKEMQKQMGQTTLPVAHFSFDARA